MSHAHAQLAELRIALRQLSNQQIGNHAFSAAARAHPALLQALPPRYGQVLLDLLDRLEAGATFTDEGCCCSFSHGALVESVGQWVARAGQALDAA